MDKIDYKKEYKDLYLPKTKPMTIEVPNMKFIMVEGKGNPNSEKGEYKEALELLYGLSFTIKMSKKGNKNIDGYFEYVVPPLEGIWWMGNTKGIDYSNKENFQWISMIRQPEFVTEGVFKWACENLENKRGVSAKKAKFQEFQEGLCVQCMHIGSYDNEPATLKNIEEYIEEQGLENDIGAKLENGIIRKHHEIYLSDPRRGKPENLKTVIRIPVKVKEK